MAADVTGRETAHRFAQRVRAERRRRQRRWLVSAAVLVVAAVAVTLVGRSSLLRVGTVDVKGATRSPAAEVLAAASVRAEAPMWRLDTAAVRRRVESLPRVRTAVVSRSWPRTIRIVITERQPVAAAKLPKGGVVVVDNGGAEIERVVTPPAGLLPITLTSADLADTAQARRPLVTAALTVAVALPPPIRSRVVLVKVASTESVQLVLSDGKVVQWGSADRSARKAAVLTALLATPYTSYDVSAPESPAVR